MTAVENPPVRRLADWSAGRLRALAAEHDTPVYVLDVERVRENYRRLEGAFPDADVRYAAKANAARPVLQTLAAEGAGVECASAGEVERALNADFPGSRVQYTAVNPPARDLDRVVDLAGDRPGLTVTCGARDTLDRLAERGFDGRVCVRVNPGVGAGHHEKVATGADAKFGVPFDRAVDVLAAASERFDLVGVHAHAGSGISGDDLDAHRELVARVGEVARAAPTALEFVDVGGGLGVPYRPERPPLDLDAVADATRDALGAVDADLAIEPGRYLVADAGTLVTAVNTVKEAPGATANPPGESPTHRDERRLVVGVDAGMTTLARPALYDAHHEIRPLSADAGDRPDAAVTVAGPICESADVFGEYELPRPERGDLMAVGNAGAYGYEMANQYNSRPRPATVVVDGDRSAVARRRESIDDVTAAEREVEWL